MKQKVKRVYDPPESDDGVRILVDRLWPRGVAKSRAKVDLWLKDAAPSTTLRVWFAHDPARWDEFKQRYFRELKEKEMILASIRRLARQKVVTLLYGARDEENNNAVALRGFLEKSLSPHPKRKVNPAH